MQKYVLFYDSYCVACSQVAREVERLAISDLGVISLNDPLLTQALNDAGIEPPDRPGLLVNDDSGLRVLHGWSMRKRLAGVVGWRNARALTRLLSAEWRARFTREAEHSGTTRRRIIGTAAAGVAGIAIMPRGLVRKAGATSPSATPATASDIERALASDTMRRAVKTWGPVHPGAIELTAYGERMLAFYHRSGEGTIITIVDNAVPRNPVGLSLGKSPAPLHGIRYFTVSGVPMADLVPSDDGKARLVRPATAGGTMEPDFNRTCWYWCMLTHPLIPSCSTTCLNCFQSISPAITCSICLACAGPYAFYCYKNCP